MAEACSNFHAVPVAPLVAKHRTAAYCIVVLLLLGSIFAPPVLFGWESETSELLPDVVEADVATQLASIRRSR